MGNIYKEPWPRIDKIKMNQNEIFSENKADNLRAILEYLQRNEHVFKDESVTYVFKQAVAILNHTALKGLNNSEYGLDGHYLSEKIRNIEDEIA